MLPRFNNDVIWILSCSHFFVCGIVWSRCFSLMSEKLLLMSHGLCKYQAEFRMFWKSYGFFDEGQTTKESLLTIIKRKAPENSDKHWKIQTKEEQASRTPIIHFSTRQILLLFFLTTLSWKSKSQKFSPLEQKHFFFFVLYDCLLSMGQTKGRLLEITVWRNILYMRNRIHINNDRRSWHAIFGRCFFDNEVADYFRHYLWNLPVLGKYCSEWVVWRFSLVLEHKYVLMGIDFNVVKILIKIL